MFCPRGHGKMIVEKTIAEGELIEIIHCLICAEYACPPENLELRKINTLVYKAGEKAKQIEGYNVYGEQRKRRENA